MNIRTPMCLALAVPLFAAACSDDAGSSGDVTAQDVKNETSEALGAMGDLASQTKDQIVNEFEKQYEKIKPRIEQLKASAKTMSADARVELQEQIDALKEKQGVFEKRLTEIKAASGDAWKELSAGTKSAWDDLERTFTNATSEFSKVGADKK